MGSPAALRDDPAHPQPLPPAGGERWQRPLQLLGGAWAALLLLFWRDAADMVGIWWNSSSFNHCLLIIPVLGWLVIQRKELLSELTSKPWWPALLYGAAGAGGWLLGDAAGVALARQLGLVMMLQGSVAAILGFQVARGLLFPLFFMFFLVPFGEELVPPLQTLTAEMCMALLQLFGIPAHIDGIFITTPGGYFRVAEACSGIEFLIAMITLGTLVANLCYYGWGRRIAFMAACFVVPVLANGIRAFGTIYIAQHVGLGFAAGFDHIVFGWIFFAIVIAIVIGGAWRTFDKSGDAPAFDPATLQADVERSIAPGVAVAAVLAIAAIPMAWSAFIANRPSPIPAQIAMPQVKGWQIVPYAPTKPWTPRFDGANHYLFGRYQNAAGQHVDLFAVVYDRQAEGRELVGYGQGAIDPIGHWSWAENMPAPANGKAEYIKTKGLTRDVVSFYRIDGITTGSATKVKLATMKTRLLGGHQQAVAILVSAERDGDRSNRPAIDAFIRDVGNIDKVADHLAGLD